jgi:acyl-CoA reductase-like NAD-dependent aldehyde dehydrogenase
LTLAALADSDYGLGGSVWTTDAEHGKDVARRVRTGTIGINGYLPDPGAPFDGVKASGIGRELGPDAVTTARHNGYMPTFRPGTTASTAAAASLSHDQGYPRVHTARHQP